MKIRASEIARAWPTTVQVQFRMTRDSGVRKDSRGIRSSSCQLSASVQTQHDISEIVIGCCNLLQSHVPYVHWAAAIGHALSPSDHIYDIYRGASQTKSGLQCTVSVVFISSEKETGLWFKLV